MLHLLIFLDKMTTNSATVLPQHPNQANILRMSSLIEMRACQLDLPDDYGEDLHPFYFDNHLYNMLCECFLKYI